MKTNVRKQVLSLWESVPNPNKTCDSNELYNQANPIEVVETPKNGT
jgi:hypothetical protein